jgi:hypothetical protein
MVRDHQPGEAVFRSILLEDIDSRDVGGSIYSLIQGGCSR